MLGELDVFSRESTVQNLIPQRRLIASIIHESITSAKCQDSNEFFFGLVPFQIGERMFVLASSFLYCPLIIFTPPQLPLQPTPAQLDIPAQTQTLSPDPAGAA